MKNVLKISLALILGCSSLALAQTNTFPTSGNVGIGTLSPSYKLDVHGDWAFRQNGYFYGTAYAYEESSNQYLHYVVSGGKGYVGMQSANDLILQSNGGKVGIGTSSPQQKLDVRGNLILENNGNPILYTGTGSLELNRYLQLINSPGAGNASGLKAGGILVADTYAYASPGKNDLIVKGKIGVGTSNPSVELEIKGSGNSVGDAVFQQLVQGTGAKAGIDISHAANGGIIGYANIGSGPLSNVFYVTNGSAAIGDKGLTMDNEGNFGIGTASPNQKLNVFDGNISLKVASNANEQSILFQNSGNSYTWKIGRVDAGSNKADLVFNSGASSDPSTLANKVIFKTTGEVGIGTSSPDSKLTVKGIIHAEEVKVDLNVPGPDYVFDENYPLASLEDTKAYIEQNKHLPGIPSSHEMQQNGVNLLEMNMKLLEKVEELTLHLIEMKKDNEEQKKINQKQQDQLNALVGKYDH